jgi:hypothetical protein
MKLCSQLYVPAVFLQGMGGTLSVVLHDGGILELRYCGMGLLSDGGTVGRVYCGKRVFRGVL